MGQKTHPTGFRIGVNKKHNSNWFANYANYYYSDALKEDYRIRNFVKKEFATIYNKAGVSKLEINRKVNQLELLIHAARPRSIASDSRDNQAIINIKDKLKRLVSGSKQIRIKVIQIANSENESSLVAKSIADQIEKRVAFRRAIRQTTQNLQKVGVKGYKIQVSGRLNGAEIARTEWVRDGRVPLQTLRADISYATQKAFTTYGVIGIKVWIFNKEIF